MLLLFRYERFEIYMSILFNCFIGKQTICSFNISRFHSQTVKTKDESNNINSPENFYFLKNLKLIFHFVFVYVYYFTCNMIDCAHCIDKNKIKLRIYLSYIITSDIYTVKTFDWLRITNETSSIQINNKSQSSICENYQ